LLPFGLAVANPDTRCAAGPALPRGPTLARQGDQGNSIGVGCLNGDENVGGQAAVAAPSTIAALASGSGIQGQSRIAKPCGTVAATPTIATLPTSCASSAGACLAHNAQLPGFETLERPKTNVGKHRHAATLTAVPSRAAATMPAILAIGYGYAVRPGSEDRRAGHRT